MTSETVEAERIKVGEIAIQKQLFDFVNLEVIPNTGVDSELFWSGLAKIISQFAPINADLLNTRDTLQTQIDQWHQSQPSTTAINQNEYKQFLQDIRYLVDEPENFSITTTNTDDEVARVAGPQLVVPVKNARFALNACNARWGSLYDALYGSDVIEEQDGLEKGEQYNPKRGAEVIEFGRNFLESYFPLLDGSYSEANEFKIEQGSLLVTCAGQQTTLVDNTQFIGYCGTDEAPNKILLKNHGLHVELIFDANHPIGKNDNANISDIILESAITTIMDCEDSVAAVDTEDKIEVYRNWLQLMTGTLTAEVTKNGKTFKRKMHGDRSYTSPNGDTLYLPGRSLMFVRNVGLLMKTDAILLNGQPIPEGILDGAITCLAALHDLRDNGAFKNSKLGSIYVVKPKLHGPEEVAFTHQLFSAIEQLLELSEATIKLGIMDEERRTSVNLSACIKAAENRVAFINTGFLDRTGDEIHTSMQAGAFAPKSQLKNKPWMNAYEKNNVAIGLLCGLHEKAQIGKGMWAMPDNLKDMMVQKIAQPISGASTAWVPSPTAATLHAVHYHEVEVSQRQIRIQHTAQPDIDTVLQIPLLEGSLTEKEIKNELENNIQGILGYVVRWVDQGIGCSKVPDIDHTNLMEDRATLRISSQHICNWLKHGICSPQQVEETLAEMAKIVDEQNKHDPSYQPMSNNLAENLAFQAAKALIFEGAEQPSGYTEPLLHQFRLKAKAREIS